MEEEGSRFLNYLDRRRDCLVVLGEPWGIHRELDLHLLSCGIVHDSFTMKLLREGLSAMALYLVSRPRFESFGWTLSFQEPKMNLFFAGSARENTVVGRAFLENVQPAPCNRFYAQISRPVGDLQTSCVEFDGEDIYQIVEQYVAKSDQQPLRLFRGNGGKVALVMAFPGADREGLRSLKREEVFGVNVESELKLIAEHRIFFRCGCDSEKISKFVAGLYKDNPEELFRGDPSVEVECPRCGARQYISRDLFDKAAEEVETGSK